MASHAMTKRSKRIRPAIEPLEGRTLLAAGVADTTFGGAGYVTTPVGTQWDASAAIAVQNDLKVVSLGQSQWASGPNWKTTSTTLVRYNPNGTLDSSFGKGGEDMLWSVNSTSYYDTPASLALQPDGKIVVVGTSNNPTGSNFLYVMRLNANGTYDTSFGGGTGKVETSSTIMTWSLAIQADGKILVEGTVDNTTSLELVRYNANGTLDTTFGAGGVVIDSAFTPDSNLNFTRQGGLAIDSSGRIVVAGYVGSVPSCKMAVIRFNTSGSVDTTFGSGGIASVLAPGFNWNQGDSLALQADGKIVVAGNGIESNPSAPQRPLVLARFNTNGSLDNQFGSAGFFVDTQLGVNQWASVAVEGDGKLVVLARAPFGQTTSSPMELTRVLSDGSGVDPSFGQNGVAVVNFGSASGSGDRPFQVVIAPDGKFVVTGMLYSKSVLGAARFLGNPLTTTTTLTSSLNPSTSGQSATFTATVAAPYDTPTGTVQFYDGTTLLGSGTLSTVNGVTSATFTTAALAVGTHTITATYSGDSNDLAGTSAALSQVVNATATAATSPAAPSSVTLAASPYRVAQGTVPSSPGAVLAPLSFDDSSFPTGPLGARRRRPS